MTRIKEFLLKELGDDGLCIRVYSGIFLVCMAISATMVWYYPGNDLRTKAMRLGACVLLAIPTACISRLLLIVGVAADKTPAPILVPIPNYPEAKR